MSPPGSSRNQRPADTTILVVDDDLLMLRLVQHTLAVERYRVWTASRADEARKLLAELAGAVDIVLTDIAMPGGLGSELAAEIRSSRPWVIVLYMSAYSRDELLGHGIDIPQVQILTKPFVPAELLSRIQEVLATR